jgi:small-conductance mechanosensitive channel
MEAKKEGKKCCGCTTALGMEATTDLLISAVVFMLTVAIIYLVETNFDDADGLTIYFEVALLFAAVIYFIAVIYLRSRVVGKNADTYKSILEENYAYLDDQDDKKDNRSCWETSCSGNTYLVVGWLALIGTIPICFFPVPVMGMYILITALVLIVCFIVASTPRYLAMNQGKGSVHYCEGTECQKSCGSDVVMMLLGLAVIGVLLVAVSIVNAVFNLTSLTAWLWFVAAVLFTIGMFFWYHFSIPEDDVPEGAEGDETQQMLPPPKATV